MPKISIIIPVYNVEKYLRQCLDSVINQTLKDIEIICVNDGSTDNSPAILEEYASKDNRVKVVNQKNAGAAAARNLALQNVCGKYIAFVDSDDFAHHNMCEVLYDRIEETGCDIAICDFNYADGLSNILDDDIVKPMYVRFERYGIFNYKTNPFEVLNLFQNAPWNKLYRTDFVKSTGLSFQNIRRAEDIYFTRGLMLSTEKICCVAQKLISYRLLETSLEAGNYKNPYCAIEALYALKEFLIQKGLYETLSLEFKSFTEEAIYYISRSIKNHLFIYAKFLFNLRKKILKDFGLKYNEVRKPAFLKTVLRNIFDINNGRDRSYKLLTVFGINFRIKKKKPSKILPYKSSKTPLISVIICNYNNGEYLERCLKSISGQSLQNIEIICVDDGSTDNSLHILEKYAVIDNRIKVISQKNQKQGAARNNALKISKGNYVVFVDSDDWLRFDALDKLFNMAKENKLDMLSYAGADVQKETMEKDDIYYHNFSYLPENFKAKWFNYKKFKKYLLKMAVSCCLTMYKRNFIEENNIRFPEGIFFEDNIFFTKALFLAKRCGILNEKLYFRLIHENQVTSNKTKNFGDYILMVKKMKELIDELDIEGKIKFKYIISYVKLAYSYYNDLSEEEKSKFKKGIDEILIFYDDILDDKYYDFKDKILSTRKTPLCKQIYILGMKFKKIRKK